jgi:hypothetical protein
MMPQRLLTLPIRLGFEAARTTLGITTRLVGTAIDLARSVRGDSEPYSPPASPERSEPRPEPAGPGEPSPREARRADSPRPEQRVNGQPAPAAPPPPPAVDVTPPSEQPDTPLTTADEAVKTLDDTDEVVATVAEPGAEDGAGAQLDIEPPWEGYAGMKASEVVARLNQAGAAELAVVELYERAHKNRQTVLGAAAKRLKALSPPA